MRKMNLFGFQIGDNLNVSVAQGALTAGPVSVATWGGGRGGGKIAIVADRTDLKVAPDSVRFSVDLSEATFDTAGPTGFEAYDTRLHDLIYLWDFDDTGTWTAPENVLPAWKSKNTAKGPWVAHMYTSAGTYNPSVLVIEPSTGKTATATLTDDNAIEVANPDIVFPEAYTIYVNPIGDSDFPGVPSGSPKLNLDDITATTLYDHIDVRASGNNWSTPRRVRFKRGATFDNFGLLTSAFNPSDTLFEDYGDAEEPRPICNIALNGSTGNLNYGFLLADNQSGGRSYRIQNIDFRSGYDPSLASVADGDLATQAVGFIRATTSLDLMVHNCRVSGILGSVLQMYPGTSSAKNNCHMDDVYVTDFGGQYAFITSKGWTNAQSSFAATGCSVVQNPDAVDDSGVRAPFRLNTVANAHFRGCDIFHTDLTQPCLKMVETPYLDGAVVNIHSCSLEGGLWPLSFQNNVAGSPGAHSYAMNAIVDGIVIVGNPGTQNMILTRGSGLTVRNCLMIQPDGLKYPTSPRLVSFYAVVAVGTFDADIVGGAPIKAYNCTLRSDRTAAQNNSRNPEIFDASAEFTAVSLDNNHVVHVPNGSPVLEVFTPLSDTPLWTPRYKGRRDPDTLVMETQYATPMDAVKDTRPKTTPTMSPAVGTALKEPVSYQDILLRKRPEPPSMGAWEAE